MKPLFKELLLLSTIVFVCLLYKLILFIILGGNAALDINLHDTYYISPTHNALWIIIPLTCFAVYLFRAISARFTNIVVLVVLMVSTLFIIGWLCILEQFYNYFYFAEAIKQLVAEQAQNKATVTGLFYGSDKGVAALPYLSGALQIILTLFVGFIGMRIGMNMKKKEVATTDK